MKQNSIISDIVTDYYKETIIRNNYPIDALNQAKSIIDNWINDQAVKRYLAYWITIDWINSISLDDAIWVEKTIKWYAVFVHISDVTEAVPIYTPLDIEALKRTTNIYTRECVISMLPNNISHWLLSLNKDWNKLTLSIRIDLNDLWEIVNFDVYESYFRNIRRYSYESFMSDYLNRDHEFYKELKLMNEIADKRIRMRTSKWTIIESNDKNDWIYDDLKINTNVNKIPKKIIREFMILTNICAAIICVKNNYNSIFICNDLPNWKKYYSNNAWWLHVWHSSINYSHCTSPIRRYADIVLHRILKIVHLRWEKNPYTKEEIWEIAKHINDIWAKINIILWWYTNNWFKSNKRNNFNIPKTRNPKYKRR